MQETCKHEYGGINRSTGYFVRNCYDRESMKSLTRNIDFFESIYSYETDIDGKIYGPMTFDLDGDFQNNYESLKNDVKNLVSELRNRLDLTIDDFDIYFSGSKGFHIQIDSIVLGIEPNVDINKIYRRWAEDIAKDIKSIDLKIYDKRRLFRVPGSINGKSGLRKIRVSIKDLDNKEQIIKRAANPLSSIVTKKVHKMNESAAKKFASSPLTTGEIKPKSNTGKKLNVSKKLLPCAVWILENPELIESGRRNNALYNATCVLKEAGWTYEKVLETMMDWNSNLAQPMRESEVIVPIHCVYRNGNRTTCWIMQHEGYCQLAGCKYFKG